MELVSSFWQIFGGKSNDSSSYDPLAGVEMNDFRQNGYSSQIRTIEDIIKSIYENANKLRGDNDLPSKHLFLCNTFVTFYFCEFKEDTPHKVIWVLGHTELAEYLHHPRRLQGRNYIGKHFCKYGSIWQYPETVIQEAINEIKLLCDRYKLNLSENCDNNYDQDDSEDETTDSVIHTNIDENGKFASAEIEKKCENEPHMKIIENEYTLAKQIYGEAKYLMNSTDSEPKRDDFFYNMSWSFSYTTTAQKLWWVPEKHAYSRLLAHYNIVHGFRTSYGDCLIYSDAVMQDVITNVMKLCTDNKLFGDVKI